MARLKTIGFEQNDLTEGSEIYQVEGAPYLVTNVNPNTGYAEVWDSQDAVWNSMEVPWPIAVANTTFDAGGVRSGNFALHLGNGDSILIPATIRGGGGFFRTYINLESLPQSDSNALLSFKRASDLKSMVALDLAPGGILSLNYRDDDDTTATILETYSAPLTTGRYYMVELGVIGDESGTTFHVEARVNGILFATTDITNLSPTDGFFTIGLADYEPGAYGMYIDDIAVNDATGTEQNTFPGEGSVVIVPVVGNDEIVGNTGWARGGDDSGSDWGQVADATPPNNDYSYLIGNGTDKADFNLGNPYLAGIQPEDTISVVVANARWRLASAGSADLFVYLRAGSNLARQGRTITLTNTSWTTADPSGQRPDIFSTSHLPQSVMAWDIQDVASARIGIEITENTPDVYVTALWMTVEYVPYSGPQELTLEIAGVDRTNDLKHSSLSIKDNIDAQANTANFQLYNLHGLGAPNTDDEVIVRHNGVIIFAGLVLRAGYMSLGSVRRYYRIECVDYTRLLDRRQVSATYTGMTDKQIIETIVGEYAYDQGIGTYHVSEAITLAQISFNYVPVSRALDEIAQRTGRSWYIDYNKDIHFFPLTSNPAPFNLDSESNQQEGFELSKDGSRLRNRVFVRGGTELTTDPLVETIVADGEQRQFFLAEKPHEISVLLNGVAKTIGIKNIDDADNFDFMLNFQEKYVEAGNATVTPVAGDELTFSYKYDVPILVSVEDSDSIAENGPYEFTIIDQQIGTTQAARDRARAELSAYAADVVEAGYNTHAHGLRSGMYQHVTFPDEAVDEDYQIQSVSIRSQGGGVLVTSVDLASTKTLGIIKFLIELLNVNRTVGEIDPNEKVDQLLTIADTIDSISDSIGTDSAPTLFKWSNDAGTTPNKMQWDLFQWS